MDRKIVALDINPANFFDAANDLAIWKDFFNKAQEKHQLVFISSCWQQTIVYLLDLLSLNNVDVIAESGAITWFCKTNQYDYQAFLDLASINVIIHHAVITNSGIFTMGKSRVDDTANLSANYFISLQKYKDFKSLWLTDFEQTLKYENFLKQLGKLELSSIYVFSPQYHMDLAFIDQIASGQPRFTHSNFYPNNLLFTSNKVTKFNALEKYTKTQGLMLKDVHYINLDETLVQNSEQLASAVFIKKQNNEGLTVQDIPDVLQKLCAQIL